jgi:SPOR domain
VAISAPPVAAGDPAPKVVAAAVAPATALAPPPVSLPATLPTPPPAPQPTPAPTTAGASASNPISDKSVPAAKIEPAKQSEVGTEGSGAQNSDLTRELYFEVGRFKNGIQAHDETDKLAQLGFPVTAVQKGFLWTNSVHVMVGPYNDEDQAKATHENLVAEGFKPRPFEKGSRNFTLISTLTLNGTRTPEGDYVISWESYVGDANVKFKRNDDLVATANGKWEKRNVKYPRDAYVYKRNPDGSRILLEIHFGGMRQALVFGKPS